MKIKRRRSSTSRRSLESIVKRFVLLLFLGSDKVNK